MEEKKPFGTRLEAFFAGKGFYIVLILCVSVIGISAWSMLSGGAERVLANNESMAVAQIDSPALEVARTDVVAVTEPPQSALAVPPAEEAPAEPSTAEAAPEAPAALQVQDYYIWPVSGELAGAYSMAALVWNPTMQDWRTHDGVDIAAALGTQVKAAANGKVTEVYSDDLYGTTVVLSHQSGLQSVYSNLAETPTVAVGDQVGVGQVIGAVGDTALGEAGEVCHLHFAMRQDGESVDPGDYLP